MGGPSWTVLYPQNKSLKKKGKVCTKTQFYLTHNNLVIDCTVEYFEYLKFWKFWVPTWCRKEGTDTGDLTQPVAVKIYVCSDRHWAQGLRTSLGCWHPMHKRLVWVPPLLLIWVSTWTCWEAAGESFSNWVSATCVEVHTRIWAPAFGLAQCGYCRHFGKVNQQMEDFSWSLR